MIINYFPAHSNYRSPIADWTVFKKFQLFRVATVNDFGKNAFSLIFPPPLKKKPVIKKPSQPNAMRYFFLICSTLLGLKTSCPLLRLAF